MCFLFLTKIYLHQNEIILLPEPVYKMDISYMLNNKNKLLATGYVLHNFVIKLNFIIEVRKEQSEPDSVIRLKQNLAMVNHITIQDILETFNQSFSKTAIQKENLAKSLINHLAMVIVPLYHNLKQSYWKAPLK
ncbi:hypothetical protein QL285_064230 [Trifolium repens]|nr:hypothetical protein QL285_064230 [Trifolium repens]